MSQAYRRVFGTNICVTDSYRSYTEQVRVFRQRPSLAAVPGTSNHGWGLALDLGCGVQSSRTVAVPVDGRKCGPVRLGASGVGRA